MVEVDEEVVVEVVVFVVVEVVVEVVVFVVVEVVEVDMHSVLAHVPAQPFVLNWPHALSVKHNCLGQLEGQPLMAPV